MLMVQQCAGQRGQRPAQAEIALGNKGLNLQARTNLKSLLRLELFACLVLQIFDDVSTTQQRQTGAEGSLSACLRSAVVADPANR